MLFQADNIHKAFGNFTALNGVSIDVPEQSIFGLLGPNGAGKTTLIRIINKITAPDAGRLIFNGKPMQRNDIYSIGYLPEERGLYKKMKVGEQAMYLAQLKGLSKSEAHRKLKHWFEKFEIAAWWNKKVEELSKGMQQKVQFIVTIVHEPELLIFDEPFSGFDPINVELLKNEILELRKNGATIIFSTHNMASVEELCDHIALVNKSNMILNGDVKSIQETYKSNTYLVEISGEKPVESVLPPQASLLDRHLHGEHRKIRIRLDSGASPNTLIAALMQHHNLHSFNEMLPSMHDIFISKVQEDKA